jgi:hypothetical protein
MLIFLNLIVYAFAQTIIYNATPINSFNGTVPEGICQMNLQVRGGRGGQGQEVVMEVMEDL